MKEEKILDKEKQDVKIDEGQFILPLADIIETEESFLVELEMPGIKKENLDINIENDILTIKSNVDFKDKSCLKCVTQEFVLQNYKRSFTLNHTVDLDNIKAEINDGILKLTLPKSERLKPKKIEIKAG